MCTWIKVKLGGADRLHERFLDAQIGIGQIGSSDTMRPNETNLACGQSPSDWYHGPWINVLGQGVFVGSVSVKREARGVIVAAQLDFRLKERTGIQWMIVVFGLYAVNSRLHMASQATYINNVVSTQPDSLCAIEVLFKESSSAKPPVEPEARVLAALVHEWDARQCGLC